MLVTEFMAEHMKRAVNHYAKNPELRLKNPFRTVIYGRFLVETKCSQSDSDTFGSVFDQFFLFRPSKYGQNMKRAVNHYAKN